MDCVNTSLSSKVLSSYCDFFSPLAVKAAMKVIDQDTATNIDLKDIRIMNNMSKNSSIFMNQESKMVEVVVIIHHFT